MFIHKLTLLLGASALVATACNHKEEPKPASQNLDMPNATVTNTNATVAIDPLATVENRDRIKEYPDEAKFSQPQPAQMITGFSADVREAPGGESIATLEKTEGVLEIARDRRGDYYLVVYPDPLDPSKRLAGWVYKDALENTAWMENSSPALPAAKTSAESHGATTGTGVSNALGSSVNCEDGQWHLRTDRDFCGRTCKNDDDCAKGRGERCDGRAFEVAVGPTKLPHVNYCVNESSTYMPPP